MTVEQIIRYHGDAAINVDGDIVIGTTVKTDEGPKLVVYHWCIYGDFYHGNPNAVVLREIGEMKGELWSPLIRPIRQEGFC